MEQMKTIQRLKNKKKEQKKISSTYYHDLDKDLNTQVEALVLEKKKKKVNWTIAGVNDIDQDVNS